MFQLSSHSTSPSRRIGRALGWKWCQNFGRHDVEELVGALGLSNETTEIRGVVESHLPMGDIGFGQECWFEPKPDDAITPVRRAGQNLLTEL